MLSSLAIFIGGGLGALCRWGVTQLVSTHLPTLPFGVVFCNVVGSFLIGLLYGHFPKPNLIITALTVGGLGGFTTFSSFSLEALKMIEQQQFLSAFSYIIVSVFLGLGACFLGISLGR